MVEFDEKIAIRVMDVIGEVLRVDPRTLNGQTDLIGELKADSLDAIQIFLRLQEIFGVTVPDERVASLDTPGSITACVSELLRETETQRVPATG